MLIKNGNVKSDNFTPSPFKNEPGKTGPNRDAPPLRLRGTPDIGSGTRIPSNKELFELMKNPAMQEAVATVEKVYKCETGLRRAVRKQLVHDRVSMMHLNVQKKAIDLSLSKKRMIQQINDLSDI